MVRDARDLSQGHRQTGQARSRLCEGIGLRAESGPAPDPASSSGTGGILFGLEANKDDHNAFLPGLLPGVLPAGIYRFANAPYDARLAALAFALGAYRFTRYRKAKDKAVRLVLPEGIDGDDLSRIVEGVTLARDLINTPANDMGPADLEAAARALAKQHGAKFRSIVGDDLLKQNFPLIHAVGRAADPARAPRLIELRWGKSSDPKVTLVGKGVCFDTGGLDLKPESAMLIMKKDMGGAATVLALAHMIMGAGLRISLRILVPAVENSVAGDAFRPLDVYPSRKGLTVEIGNTDAEGRLVLADALALACEETPDLLVDMGTLTGAARVALGPELPPYYTDDETLAAEVARHAGAENDPLWRLPLWRRYDQTSIPRWPTSTTWRPAAWPARSSARCSSSASYRLPRVGCTSIFMRGRLRPSPAGRRAANARPPARSMRCSKRRYGSR